MKNLIFSLAFFFSFFSFLVAQSVGDQKPQSEIFKNQPIWLELSKSDTFKLMKVEDYYSCQAGDVIIFWNASTHSMAVVEEFQPGSKILVVTRPNGEQFLYKFGCKNRLKYIRTVKKTPTIIYDTLHIRVIEKEVVVEKPAEDTRVQVGAVIYSGGTEYGFTESQARFFFFENQEDMRFRTWRPEGRSNSCCNGGGLDYSKFVFEPNPPRGGNHSGGKKYFGHR